MGSESSFVKQLSVSSDWIMRIADDHVQRPYLAWRAGILDQAPGCVDHAVALTERLT